MCSQQLQAHLLRHQPQASHSCGHTPILTKSKHNADSMCYALWWIRAKSMLILFTLLPFDLPKKQTHDTTEDICVICRRAHQCDVPDSIIVNGSNVCHEHLHVVLGLDLRLIPHEPVLLVTGDDIDDYAICLRQRPLQKTCMFRPHGEKQLQLSYAASGKP